MNREHGEQLNALDGLVGSLVVISTASVYADDEGRAFDGEGGDPPQLPVPILETQRTAEPGDATYSTQQGRARADAARTARCPSTLIRACAIHGPGAKHPRELYFVKRAVDGRRRVAHRLERREPLPHDVGREPRRADPPRRRAARRPRPQRRRPRPADDARDLPRDRRRARARVRAGAAAGGRVRQPVGRAADVTARRLDGGRRARARLPAGDDVPRGGARRRAPGSSASSRAAAAGTGTYLEDDARLRGRGRGARQRTRDRRRRLSRPLPDPRDLHVPHQPLARGDARGGRGQPPRVRAHVARARDPRAGARAGGRCRVTVGDQLGRILGAPPARSSCTRT